MNYSQRYTIYFVISFTIIIYVFTLITKYEEKISSLQNNSKIIKIYPTSEEIQRLANIAAEKIIKKHQSIEKKKSELIKKRIKQLQPKLDPIMIEEYSNLIIKYSDAFNLPRSLILHMIWKESSFNQMAQSNQNAVGPMQILYRVHQKELDELKIDYNSLHHLDNNIMFGCKLIRRFIDEKKNIVEALKLYVGGNRMDYVKDILTKMAEFEVELQL